MYRTVSYALYVSSFFFVFLCFSHRLYHCSALSVGSVVDYAAPQEAQEKAAPSNERQGERMRNAEPQETDHVAPRFFIQYPHRRRTI